MGIESSSNISEDRIIKGYETLNQVAQRGCEIFILGDTENLS